MIVSHSMPSIRQGHRQPDDTGPAKLGTLPDDSLVRGCTVAMGASIARTRRDAKPIRRRSRHLRSRFVYAAGVYLSVDWAAPRRDGAIRRSGEFVV
jgi:hypothetical protein